jgi:hypothetical protein
VTCCAEAKPSKLLVSTTPQIEYVRTYADALASNNERPSGTYTFKERFTYLRGFLGRAPCASCSI